MQIGRNAATVTIFLAPNSETSVLNCELVREQREHVARRLLSRWQDKGFGRVGVSLVETLDSSDEVRDEIDCRGVLVDLQISSHEVFSAAIAARKMQPSSIFAKF